MQLGLAMYVVTRLFTRSISLSLPFVPTLAMRPMSNRMECEQRRTTPNKDAKSDSAPGRSQNDRSWTSGPLICSETVLIENVSSRKTPGMSSSSSKKRLGSVLGLRIARWAHRIRSSTSSLSKMISPNCSCLGWPSGFPSRSVKMLRDTTHFQGSEEYDRRHSVGHLQAEQFAPMCPGPACHIRTWCMSLPPEAA